MTTNRLLDHSKATLAPTDLLTDFVDGTDLIGLEGRLEFADLAIADGGTADTTISVTATSEILTVAKGSLRTCSLPMTSRLLC